MSEKELNERRRAIASELSSFEMAMDQVADCRIQLRDAVAHANRMRERLMNAALAPFTDSSDSAEVRSDVE